MDKVKDIFNKVKEFIKKIYLIVKDFIINKGIPFIKFVFDKIKTFIKKDVTFFLYRVYCRLFQFVMRLALPFLPYRKPKILNNNTDLVKVLKEKGIRNVLVITDEGIVKAGLLLKLTMSLDEGNINYTVYDKTVPNPTMRNIEEARELYVSNSLEAIIALGGGSSLDLAKASGARISNPNKTIMQMKGLLKVKKTTFINCYSYNKWNRQ